MASELASFLCREAGSGGGSIEKAGGFIGLKQLEGLAGGLAADEYLRRRVQGYISNYEHIHAGSHSIDFGSLPLFRKLPLPVGFAKSADIFPDRTKISVRTLEGDIDTVSGENLYFMVGILGEVYPILREKFEKSYLAAGGSYGGPLEYVPTAINRATGERQAILPFTAACLPRGEKLVRARPLEKDTKVFSHWDLEKYFYGAPGDFLVAGEGDYGDCYIVRGDIFRSSYEAV
jgi:phosphoglycolate phosphatase